jgi:quinone-modifying oxidoreductase subunit QmoB
MDKIGVYLCKGCDIGKSLAVEKLVSAAKAEDSVKVAKEHDALCSAGGVEMVRADSAAEGLNALVLAACSARCKTDAFAFGPEKLVERVSLREQVAWSHEPNDEDTQALAEDYLKMGIVKARKAGVPQPLVQDIDKTVLVVGGGVAGLSTALETARTGYDVVLIEKDARLGGASGRLYKDIPKAPPYCELSEPAVGKLIKEVEANKRIRVFTSSHIDEIVGGPGLFTLFFTTDGGEKHELKIGAIVQATGWRPYDAAKLGHLGFGKSPNVITGDDLEKMAASGRLARPSDGAAVTSAAFILCAGSRDPNHLPYCSSVCCLNSLKQAIYIREKYPEARIYIFYKDIRTPGHYELFYKKVQEDPLIFMTKGEVRSVAPSPGNGKVTLQVDDTLLGEKIEVETDMAILATGMVPSSLGAEILNLDYRLGKDLPELKYGFPDSHYICFPYESRRTGIYAAGCVRQPMDSQAVEEDAAGAALKAIQCLELTARGLAVHPRSLDASYPDFFLQRCTQCKRCTEECPFGTLNEDEKGTPQPNTTRCRRCGICMGSCPERIISFKDYSTEIVGSMIKAVEVPDEDEEKPRVLVFACENDALPAIDIAGLHRLKHSPHLRVIPLRCLGNINPVWIADALSAGFDGILMIGCKHGDDYQCHFMKGSELAQYRMGNVQETLQRLVLEPERVKVEEVSINEWTRIPVLLDEFMETIKEIGPNPYKGF